MLLVNVLPLQVKVLPLDLDCYIHWQASAIFGFKLSPGTVRLVRVVHSPALTTTTQDLQGWSGWPTGLVRVVHSPEMMRKDSLQLSLMRPTSPGLLAGDQQCPSQAINLGAHAS